ncbi:unnamed protein product, partial [Allacma fusca]
MGSGNFAVGVGSGASAAARIMAKYSYKEGQGLGKMQQGMATALQLLRWKKLATELVVFTRKTSPKMIYSRMIWMTLARRR